MGESADPSDYLDFELEIGQGQGRDYPITIIHSPAGEASETVRFPFDELALENRLQALQIALLRSGGRRRQALSEEEQTVQAFGRDLFGVLFAGEVRNRFDVSLERAAAQGKGLRLKLRIQPPEMAVLPWEFLYDARQAEYLCLSRHTPLVRYLPLPQVIQPLAVTPPLRILGMVASPSDLEPLDIDREKERVDRAMAGLRRRGLAEVTWLEGQTWRDLQRAMRGGPWHVFHFIGHGGFDRNADEGLIALADDEGLAHCLPATQLARLLADHRSLRLAVLNACEGARGGERDVFSSTASILVRRGLPAVVAMQYAITDRAAIELVSAFYEALADNLPVDAAVAEARKAVSIAVANTVEWGTPVLYMRYPDGVLFRVRAPASSADQAAEAQRRAEEDTARQAQEEAKRRADEEAQQAARDEAARRERQEAAQRAKEEEARLAPERAAQEERAREIAALSAKLDQAKKKSGWDDVIELGERILALDVDHQPTRNKTAAAYGKRSVRHHNKGHFDQAIADSTRAIKLDPKNAVYYDSRSISYHEKGDYDRAIADQTRAIELDPKNAAYYDARSLSYYMKDDYDRAITDETRAIELDPKNAAYYDARSMNYHEKGAYDRAIADETRAIELDPEKVDYYYWRGLSYKSKGSRDAARSDFERAAAMGHAEAKKELAKLK